MVRQILYVVFQPPVLRLSVSEVLLLVSLSRLRPFGYFTLLGLSPVMDTPSLNRYSFQLHGDHYIRKPSFNFRVGSYTFSTSEDEDESDPESSYEVRSVDDNVRMLEKALHRHALGQDPFDKTWKNATVAYAEDMEKRIWSSFSLTRVGVLRQSLMDIAKSKAKSELKALVIKLSSQIVLDLSHGWVFFLLETCLGETLSQYHKSLPDDGITPDNKGDILESLKKANSSFDVDKSEAVSAIERIRLSQHLEQGFQFFDMVGEELGFDEQGLRSKEVEKVKKAPRAPGDHESTLELLNSMPKPIPDTRNVVIVLTKETWEKISAGLGNGYVSWKIEDSESGHFLLGFSSTC